MPPRCAFRLEDLRIFHQVRASCHACGHRAIVPDVALLQGQSDELPPEQARSPSDLEVVSYWDLAATERTKLNDRTRRSAPSSAATRTVAHPGAGGKSEARNTRRC